MEFIDKSQIMQGIGPDSTAEVLEKGINHKYFKREGVPGSYKYYYTEEEYKKAKNPHDSRFKFQKDTKVSFVKNGETINGIISDYDYNSVTFDKEYNIDYEKDGKTWTMIGIPEGKIQELQEDKKNLAKEIIERQKALPKEDIGKKLEATTSIVEYRRHLIDYGTKNGDKDLVEYAKNASVSALERRMKSEKTEEQFQDRTGESTLKFTNISEDYIRGEGFTIYTSGGNKMLSIKAGSSAGWDTDSHDPRLLKLQDNGKLKASFSLPKEFKVSDISDKMFELAQEHIWDSGKYFTKKEYEEIFRIYLDLDKGFSIKVGQSLKVPSSLTSDPSGKKGQFGKVTSIEDDIITLKFSDGKTGKYDRSIW